MAEDIVISIMNVTSEFLFYLISLDKSTDVCDITTQLAIFIRGVSNNFQNYSRVNRLTSNDKKFTGNGIFFNMY